jgi:hypothetical protein
MSIMWFKWDYGYEKLEPVDGWRAARLGYGSYQMLIVATSLVVRTYGTYSRD